MKFFNFTRSMALLLPVMVICSSSFAQAVNPSHLFNTGLNMGFLSGHGKTQTSKENYGTWAGNAAAEWIQSWNTGAVKPIIPDITMPSVAHIDIINAIKNMGACFNPYFQARLSLYNAGFHLGEAMAQTETSCSQCLQLDLQRSSIELRTISALIKSSLYTELSHNLNSIAASLNLDYSAELASQQNASQWMPVNTIIQTIQSDLPRGMQTCEAKAPQVIAEVTSPAEPQKPEPQPKSKNVEKWDKRDKRAFILKGGMNTGSLKGSGNLKTEGKTGWLVGFDMFNGRKFIFVSGLKFWQNATGEELMFNIPSQYVVAEDYYIQGFTIGFGPGYYIYRGRDTNFSLTGKFNYIISHAINGNLSSSGDTSLESSVFQLEFGAQFAYKILFFEASSEFGLTDALFSNQDGYKYRLFNLSIGVYIR